MIHACARNNTHTHPLGQNLFLSNFFIIPCLSTPFLRAWSASTTRATSLPAQTATVPGPLALALSALSRARQTSAATAG
jgi:hypothetical protein